MAATAIAAPARKRTLTDRLIRRGIIIGSGMRTPPPCPPLAVLAAAILLLAGCLAGCGATTRVAAGGTLQVALTEYHVAPQSVRAASGALTIEIHNYGRLSHDLVISSDGIPLASTKPIAPGQSAQLFTTLAAGRYEMSSTILSDQALGAYGTLTIAH
jgi:hypothetical protein